MKEFLDLSHLGFGLKDEETEVTFNPTIKQKHRETSSGSWEPNGSFFLLFSLFGILLLGSVTYALSVVCGEEELLLNVVSAITNLSYYASSANVLLREQALIRTPPHVPPRPPGRPVGRPAVRPPACPRDEGNSETQRGPPLQLQFVLRGFG